MRNQNPMQPSSDLNKEMLTRLMFVAQLLQRADNQQRKRLQLLKKENQKSHKP